MQRYSDPRQAIALASNVPSKLASALRKLQRIFTKINVISNIYNTNFFSKNQQMEDFHNRLPSKRKNQERKA